MSSNGTVTEGEHLIQSGAALVLCSSFGNVRMMAHNSGGNVIVSGAGSESIDCGPAALWLTSSSPVSGNVVLEAGSAGTVTIASGPPFEGPNIITTPETITL